MCRWLAYKGNPVFLDQYLFKPENSLIEQSLHAREGLTPTNGDGFGVGWYGSRDHPGLYRDILPAWNDCNLRSLAEQIRAPLFMAHVRASTGTATSRYNCHPFNFSNWLFMHNGQIGGFDKLHRQLDALIPDEAYPFKLGNTDSEILFLLLVKNGLQQDVKAALVTTIAEIEQLMSAANINDPFRFSACISDGESLYAVRYASDNMAPTVYWCYHEGRYVVASEPLAMTESDWCDLPQNSLLVINSNGAEQQQLIASVVTENVSDALVSL